MKHSFTHRLLAGLTLSSGLLFSACTDMAPAEPAPLATQSQELTKLTWAHVDLGKAAGGLVTDGYTCNAGNDIAPTCGPNSANVNLGWTAPITGTYTFSTAGSKFDTVLQVHRVTVNSSGVKVPTSVACNDDSATSVFGESSVTITANAGEEYLITVDGWGCGYFKLDISAPACNTPPGQCHAGTGTWNRASNSCDYALQPKGATCSDGDSGTVGDSCDGAGACTGIPASCSATIQCGDFECGGPVAAGSSFAILYGGNTSLSPWTIRGDGVDKLNHSTYAAQGGVVSLDMNARERGSISQNITTTPGQKYVVSFWVQWNTYGDPSSLVVEAGQTQQLYGWTLPNQSYPVVNWMPYTFEFTATSTTTKLSFNSARPGTIGALLDSVSIACGK